MRRSAFTLVELLIVIGILGLLLGIMTPAAGRVRSLARAGYCLTNLHGIGLGLVMYQNANGGCVVPSYNMPRPGAYAAVAGDVIEGWAAILERDGVVQASQGLTDNLFYCPNTSDIEGMSGGQTLYDQDKPSGYQDWPVKFLTAGGDGATKTRPSLPIAGFGDAHGQYLKEIRCGYFLNAYNPIGSAPAGSVPTCANYTQCVGYGPYADGNLPVVRPNMRRPSALIVACDGMYMGRQSVTRLGEQNRRVGYRHLGDTLTVKVNGVNTAFAQTVSNAVFADGHVEPIRNNDFPHGNVLAENDGRYSLLADH
jgi:prepilin-type N-terminal cleavage/methylation domain-containing protein/prepilin-type processing-associated H-X9-DG protein